MIYIYRKSQFSPRFSMIFYLPPLVFHQFSPQKTTAPLVEAAWINAAISVAVINSLRTREVSISAKSCCSWINQRSFTKAPGISMAFFGGFGWEKNMEKTIDMFDQK